MNSAIFNFRRYVYEKPSKSVRYDHLDPHSCCCGIHFRFDQQDPRPLCRHAAAVLFSACDSISHCMDCALYFNGHIRLYDQPVGRRQKKQGVIGICPAIILQLFLEYHFFPFFLVSSGVFLAGRHDRPHPEHALSFFPDKTSGRLSSDPLSFLVLIRCVPEFRRILAKLTRRHLQFRKRCGTLLRSLILLPDHRQDNIFFCLLPLYG